MAAARYMLVGLVHAATTYYNAVTSARGARILEEEHSDAWSMTQRSWTGVQSCPQLALTIQFNSNLLPHRPLTAQREAMASKLAAWGTLLAIFSCTLPG